MDHLKTINLSYNHLNVTLPYDGEIPCEDLIGNIGYPNERPCWAPPTTSQGVQICLAERSKAVIFVVLPLSMLLLLSFLLILLAKFRKIHRLVEEWEEEKQS